MPQPVFGCDPSTAFIDTCNLPSRRADRIASGYDRHTIHLGSFVHLHRQDLAAMNTDIAELLNANA